MHYSSITVSNLLQFLRLLLPYHLMLIMLLVHEWKYNVVSSSAHLLTLISILVLCGWEIILQQLLTTQRVYSQTRLSVTQQVLLYFIQLDTWMVEITHVFFLSKILHILWLIVPSSILHMIALESLVCNYISYGPVFYLFLFRHTIAKCQYYFWSTT